jgi:hypothetical protein
MYGQVCCIDVWPLASFLDRFRLQLWRSKRDFETSNEVSINLADFLLVGGGVGTRFESHVNQQEK